MKLAILSDTHGLLRPQVVERLKTADAILHGGDINRQDIVDQLERSIAAVGNVTSVLDAGASAEELLRMLFVGMDLRLLETEPVCYRCYCSRDRVASTLLSLGERELTDILAEGETVTVSCQFCDAEYAFTPDDIRELIPKIHAEN